MTQKEHRYNHALHNYKACQALKKMQDYPDWVITTAFYSALQFVKYKMFPLELEGKTFNEFENYFILQKQKGNRDSKHTMLVKLVKEQVRHIHPYYRGLRQYCDNARYLNYKVNPQEVEFSLRYLEEIKKVCDFSHP